MIDLPLFYLTGVIAVLIAGVSKGGFGGGLGIIAVPLMSLTIPPFQAAAIMLPILCVMDLAGLKAFWRRWHTRNLTIMLPGAMVGILLAVITYRWTSEDALRVLVGVIAVGFALNFYLNQRAAQQEPREAHWGRGTFWSAVSGFTSFSAHAGGPPASIYLLPQRLDKTAFVGTTVVLFTAINYVKLVPYTFMGQFQPENLMTSLVLAPAAVCGVYMGVYLHTRVPLKLFYRICYFFLLLTGLRLLQVGLFPA